MVASTSLFQLVRLTSSDAVSAKPGRLMAVKATGVTNDCIIELTNDDDGLSTNIVTVGFAAEKGSCDEDFTKLGGVSFSTSIYAAITGTCEAHFWIS